MKASNKNDGSLLSCPTDENLDNCWTFMHQIKLILRRCLKSLSEPRQPEHNAVWDNALVFGRYATPYMMWDASISSMMSFVGSTLMYSVVRSTQTSCLGEKVFSGKDLYMLNPACSGNMARSSRGDNTKSVIICGRRLGARCWRRLVWRRLGTCWSNEVHPRRITCGHRISLFWMIIA